MLNKKYSKIIIILLALLCGQSYCQSPADNYINILLDDTKIFFNDAYSFWSYPIRMNQNEWLAAAGFGLGTYLLIPQDDQIRKNIATEIDRYDNTFWNIFEKYGVVQYAEIAGTGVYAIGLFSGNHEIRKLGRMTVQSLTYSGLSAMFIRMIAGRKRPIFTDDPKNFIGFTTNNSYQSFPSGHVTVAFAFSTVFAEYFDTPLSRIGFYGFAGLAAVERLINSQHWFTDVALGACLGVLGGIHVLKEEEKRMNKNNNSSRLSLFPSFNGITLQYRIN